MFKPKIASNDAKHQRSLSFCFSKVKNTTTVGVHLFENALIEELLELFVTVVDAELLKTVDLEVLCTHKTFRSA